MPERLVAMASAVVPELGPVATIAAAAAAGFDAVGLWIEPENWDAALLRETASAISDSGLAIIDVEAIWLRPGPLPDRARRVIDIGLRLGAANALVVSSDPDIASTAEQFASLCDHSAGSELRINLEFGPFAEIATIDQARQVLAAVQQPEAALLLDPYHVFRSGGTIADIDHVPARLIAYAQFCDAYPTGKSGIFGDRALPGQGALPLDAFVSALPAGIPLSVELRSPTLYAAETDPHRRAQLVANASRAFLDRHASRV